VTTTLIAISITKHFMGIIPVEWLMYSNADQFTLCPEPQLQFRDTLGAMKLRPL